MPEEITETTPAGSTGPFDINALPEDQKAAFQAYVEDQKQGVLKKNEELLGKYNNLKTERDTLASDKATIDEALHGRTLDEVKETLSSLDQANIEQLMKDGRFKEALELRENATVSRIQKQHEQALKAAQDESSSKDERLSTLTKKVERMTIGKVASSIFLETDNARNSQSVLNDVEEKALALFQLDEEGNPVAMRNGDIAYDGKGQPLSIEMWVKEELRSSHSHYWEEVVGAGGKGSGGAGSANGYGTGITTRKGASSTDMAKFMGAVREKNPKASPRDEWLKLPND